MPGKAKDATPAPTLARRNRAYEPDGAREARATTAPRSHAVHQGRSRHARFRPSAVVLSCGLALTGPPTAWAGEPSPPGRQLQQLDEEIQSIKQELLGITEELWSLEEKLLYPVEHRLIVLITVTESNSFSPDTVGLRLDGETLVRHRYSESEVAALRNGGVHRLYVGTVAKGDHILQATLAGKGREGEAFNDKSEKKFSKGLGPKYIELQIQGANDQPRPELVILEW